MRILGEVGVKEGYSLIREVYVGRNVGLTGKSVWKGVCLRGEGVESE